MNKKTNSLIFLLMFLISGIVGIIPMISNINTSGNMGRINCDTNSKIHSNTNLKNPSASAINWSETGWHYRIPVNISAPSNETFTNKIISANLNFTQILLAKDVTSAFDNKSIRIIEYNSSSGQAIFEVPCQFDESNSYNAQTDAYGILNWGLNGTTQNGTTRYYFIYFDTTDHGSKTAPIYNTGLKLDVNTANYDYSIENNYMLVSLKLGTLPGTNEQNGIYNVVNKVNNQTQLRSGQRLAWQITYWDGSSNNNPVITNLKVVTEGSVAITLEMYGNSSSYNYARYYTLDYLNNYIEIKQAVTATQSISFGPMIMDNDLVPGTGQGDQCQNPGYGLGGYNFTGVNGIPPANLTLGSDFTSDPYNQIYNVLNGWNPLTAGNAKAPWFTMWDEGLLEGVATNWIVEPNLPMYAGVIAYGDQDNSNQEGRFGLQYQIPDLSAGQQNVFIINGFVYSGTNGTYIKNEALTININPTVETQTLETNGATIHYNLKDLDGSPISNANITLLNSSGQIIDNKFTNTNGSVEFNDIIQNDVYSLKAYYTVGCENYLIDENLSQTITNTDFYINDIGNLTTVKFFAKDGSSSLTVSQQKLMDANITISNSSSGSNITSTVTSIYGYATFQLPTSSYNISLWYQGSYLKFELNDTGTSASTQNFTLNSYTYYNLTSVLTNDKTNLTIVNTEYTGGSDQSQAITSQPYSIVVYYGTNINITCYFEDLQNSSAIPGASQSYWNVYNASNNLVANGQMVENGTTGNYSIYIQTSGPGFTPGIYSIFANASQSGCQNSIMLITLEIINCTSQLSFDKGLSMTNVDWNQDIIIGVTYNELMPYNIPISGAIVTGYLLSDPSKTVNLADISNGDYSFTYNTSSLGTLGTGTFCFVITAQRPYEDSQTIYVYFTVNTLHDNLSWNIGSNYELSNLYMKVAQNENVTFMINYTASDGSYLPDANIVVIMNYTYLINATDMGNGLYKVEFNSSDYNASLNDITINCLAPHYERQSGMFSLQILDYWNTGSQMIVPPAFYPWNNTASFVFKYFCNDEPRNGVLLSNAIISRLNVTVTQNSSYNTQFLFDSSNLGILWGYTNLQADPTYGPGYYSVWFTTGVLTVTKDTSFNVEPTISQQYYRPLQFTPYVWVRTPYTSLTAYQDKNPNLPTDFVSLYLDQSLNLQTIYNVTDSLSALNGQLINNAANVSYIIYNIDNITDVKEKGNLTELYSDGAYNLNTTVKWIGTFGLNITATKVNYSEAVTTLTLVVNPRIIGYHFGSNVVDEVLTTPINQEVNLTLILQDDLLNTTLSGAHLTFYFGGQNYQFSSDSPGVYYFTFTKEILATVQEGNSYAIDIMALKQNYKAKIIEINLAVGLAVDPYFGIAYRYWAIMGVTAAAVISAVLIYKGIQYARIPIFVKQVNETLKIISNNIQIDRKSLRKSRKETIYEGFSKYWIKIGLEHPDKTLFDNESKVEPGLGPDTTSTPRGEDTDKLEKGGQK